MKLVNLEQFTNLPKWTIFSYWNEKHQTICSGTLNIKGISYDNQDFTYQSLTEIWFEFENDWMANMEIAEKKLEAWESISVDIDCYWRDGMFDKKQRFLIYEDDDKRKIAYLLLWNPELLSK